MKIKYTDNHGKTKYLEVPDDTQESVLEFLDESERTLEQEHRRDRYRLTRFEMTDEELFRSAVHKPKAVGELFEELHEKPKKIEPIMRYLKAHCTEKQLRRFYLHCLYGIPTNKIALMESCTSHSVRVSIRAVIKCLQNIHK